MIEAIKRYWVAIVAAIILVAAIPMGYAIVSWYAGHVEKELASLRIEDGAPNYEDYMSMYSGVTAVVGNYITGIAAFLTLLLLGAQFYEIRESKRRYEDDKKIEKISREKDDIDRFIKKVEEKIECTHLVIRGAVSEKGVKAYSGFADRLESYFDNLNLESCGLGNRALISGMDCVVDELIYVLFALKAIGGRSKKYEVESVEYFKSVYLLGASEVFRLLGISLAAILVNEKKVIKGNCKEIEKLYLMLWHLSGWGNCFDEMNNPDHVDAPMFGITGDDNYKYIIELDIKYFL